MKEDNPKLENLMLVLVGNKSDLKSKRRITYV